MREEEGEKRDQLQRTCSNSGVRAAPIVPPLSAAIMRSNFVQPLYIYTSCAAAR